MSDKIPKDFDYLYWLLRLIGDVIMISLVKTLFSKSMVIDQKLRRSLLIASVIMLALNILGIYRNSYTLWKYQDAMNFFFLGIDIAQLLYCGLLWAIVYFRDAVTVGLKKLFMYSSIFFCLLNVYYFLMNFHWLPEEGLQIFLFWFLNNAGMITFCAAIAYLIYTKKVNVRLDF